MASKEQINKIRKHIETTLPQYLKEHVSGQVLKKLSSSDWSDVLTATLICLSHYKDCPIVKSERSDIGPEEKDFIDALSKI